MARSNYSFQKRQKELARKKKKELKRQSKIDKKNVEKEQDDTLTQDDEQNPSV